MVSVVALLCAAMIAQSDCSVDNAIDVIRLPDVTSELNCVQGAVATLASLEPIQEVRIHEQQDDLVKRRSMRRIMARRMKAATVRA